MKSVLALVLFLTTHYSVASFNNQIDIEAKLENRIQQILSSIDTHVQVYVKVELKQINSPLPGVSSEKSYISTTALTDQIDFDDIKKINVNIIGSVEKLPEWMLVELKKTVNIAQTQMNFSYQQYDLKFLSEIEKQNPIFKASEQIQKSIMKDFNNKANVFIVLFMVGIIIFSVTLFMIALKIKKTLINQTQYLAEQLNQNESGSHSIIDLSQTDSARIPNESQNTIGYANKLQNMSYEAILSLMSDCYWTHNDTYAHFIWQNISYEQQIRLLNSVDYFHDYSEYFITLGSQDLEEASHPFYFRGHSPLTFTSQKEIEKQLKSNPSLWHQLSPLRQKCLKLNIEDKMKCLQSSQKNKAQFTILDNKTSEYRKLPKTQTLSELSLDDEISILENPHLISFEMKSQIHTLIWFSKLDLEKRKEILSHLSAEDIALAYIGPDEVLSSIHEAISEKKFKLVQSISQRIRPNRKSESFKYIFEKSLAEAA